MAVCGRCLLCGHKFDGDNTPDVAVRWVCESAVCEEHIDRAAKAWNEQYTHAICTQCHDNLMNGTVGAAVNDLAALLARRSD